MKSIPRKISHRGISTTYDTDCEIIQPVSNFLCCGLHFHLKYTRNATVSYDPLYKRVKVVIICLCGTKVFPQKWLFVHITIVGNRPGSIMLLLVH